MPAISKLSESDDHVGALLKAIYSEDEYKVFAGEEIGFDCDCSCERFEAALVTLGREELRAIEDEGHGTEITCQLRGKTCNFTEDDLEGLIND